MKATITLFFINIITILTLFSQTGFTINANADLIDDNGNPFILKGMNVPLSWYVNDVNGSIDDVRLNTGSNCLRIVVNTTTPDIAWQTAVQNCIDNDMIPMVELHDVTGSTSASDLNQMAQFWASKASYFNQPEIKKHILINIANEWGTWFTATDDANNPNGGDWLDAFTIAIKTIRDAGITTTLVIDAVGYGQDRFAGKNIKDDAQTMMASDASFLGGNANLLFSIHMYCEWRIGGDDPAAVGDIKAAGIPILIGEFGYQHATDGSCDIDEQKIMDVGEQYGVGWLAWSQKGNSGGVEYLDLCNDWNCTSLSNWGNTIVNGRNGTKTAVTASVFNNSVELPLDFLTFDLKEYENTIDLLWTTANESNISHFNIQRSNDGINFYNIGFIHAENDIYNTYSFKDQLSDGFVSNVYRIEIVEYDNTVRYSELKVPNKSNSISLNIYPNPVLEELIIETTLKDIENLNWSLYDIDGQRVIEGIFSDFRTKVNMVNYKQGFYSLRVLHKVDNSEKTLSKTFTILKM